jgi:hypothetical protein
VSPDPGHSHGGHGGHGVLAMVACCIPMAGVVLVLVVLKVV